MQKGEHVRKQMLIHASCRCRATLTLIWSCVCVHLMSPIFPPQDCGSPTMRWSDAPLFWALRNVTLQWIPTNQTCLIWSRQSQILTVDNGILVFSSTWNLLCDHYLSVAESFICMFLLFIYLVTTMENRTSNCVLVSPLYSPFSPSQFSLTYLLIK